MTQSLHQYLDVNQIAVQREVSSPKKLLQEMAKLLSNPLQASTEENIEKKIYHCLLEREKIGNTGIGNGIALPHSRCIDTKQAVVALITLSKAIDYDSLDRQPVDVAFGLIVPQEASQEHLNLLAEIARMMSRDDNKQQLSSMQTPAQVIELIKSWTAA